MDDDVRVDGCVGDTAGESGGSRMTDDGRLGERISVWAGTPGDTTRVREGGEKEGRQRERISARARTPSGDTTKVP